MPHRFERAVSARAKCRGCGANIAAGVVRFGEALPNPFAEGEMLQWFHPECAALKRPEPFLAALAALAEPFPEAEGLRGEAERGLAHRRLPRINGLERASSGRAQCRACRGVIARDGWRIPLVFWEDGRFQPGGFVHVRCAAGYFETSDAASDVLPRLKRLASAVSEEGWREVEAELTQPSA